jgi:signal transduction histidine kinase
VNARPIRLLLVEDSATDALLLGEALAGAGAAHELVRVERLHDALERLGQGGLDVVLLDLGLPDSQGLDTVVRLRGLYPDLPVVVLTGHADESLALKTLQVGAEDYLVKGEIEGRALVRALRYAIERGRAERELRGKSEELSVMSQQLWQAAKLATVGELTASIAHELNNPLATVALWVESLLEQVGEDHRARRALEVIDQELERMSALVAELLQFSRRGGGEISTVDVREEVAKTLALLQRHLASRGIQVWQESAPELPPIRADRQQLRQLFLNLLSNAGDAMPQGGRLLIRTGAGPDGAVVVEFVDSGVGVAAEDLPRLTEPFFTTKPVGKGTGLGLAICRRIAQQHRGSLAITSAGRGQGAAVRVTLGGRDGEETVTGVFAHD